jgi:hypothetical protein
VKKLEQKQIKRNGNRAGWTTGLPNCSGCTIFGQLHPRCPNIDASTDPEAANVGIWVWGGPDNIPRNDSSAVSVELPAK